MAHDIYWLKQERVLYVNYKGHQTPETLKACLDDMAAEFDKVNHPVVVLINWLEVTECDKGTLKSQPRHRAYTHPNAARGVLVGFEAAEALQNEITAVSSRKSKNTIYFATMAEAKAYLKDMLEMV